MTHVIHLGFWHPSCAAQISDLSCRSDARQNGNNSTSLETLEYTSPAPLFVSMTGHHSIMEDGDLGQNEMHPHFYGNNQWREILSVINAGCSIIVTRVCHCIEWQRKCLGALTRSALKSQHSWVLYWLVSFPRTDLPSRLAFLLFHQWISFLLFIPWVSEWVTIPWRHGGAWSERLICWQLIPVHLNHSGIKSSASHLWLQLWSWYWTENDMFTKSSTLIPIPKIEYRQ